MRRISPPRPWIFRALLFAGVAVVPLAFSWAISGETAGIAVVANPTPIRIPSVGSAFPYGSSILVDLHDQFGQTPFVTNVAVTLDRFGHKRPEDVDILLVGPRGQSTMLLSDVGRQSVSKQTLTFDQRESDIPQDPIATGRYQPVDVDVAGDTDEFPGLSTPRGYTVDLSRFVGQDPNGPWSLYVVDDRAGFRGRIKGGWSITFTTASQGSTDADSAGEHQ